MKVIASYRKWESKDVNSHVDVRLSEEEVRLIADGLDFIQFREGQTLAEKDLSKKLYSQFENLSFNFNDDYVR